VNRQILGGMGIVGDFPIMRHMMNLESVVTYEGTHDIHLLITGQDITGLERFFLIIFFDPSHPPRGLTIRCFSEFLFTKASYNLYETCYGQNKSSVHMDLFILNLMLSRYNEQSSKRITG
jgi:hypothetical protein